MRALLDSDIVVKNYVASDICFPLINLWNEIKKRPIKLSKQYKHYWKYIQKDYNNYYRVREEFNKDKSNAGAFLCLTRTSVNGMIRFNSDGNFNASFHLNRAGIKPDKLKEIILDWSYKIQHVSFICGSYDEIVSNTNKEDFCFLDPPC